MQKKVVQVLCFLILRLDRMAQGTGETDKVIKEVLGNFRSQGFIKQLEETARTSR